MFLAKTHIYTAKQRKIALTTIFTFLFSVFTPTIFALGEFVPYSTTLKNAGVISRELVGNAPIIYREALQIAIGLGGYPSGCGPTLSPSCDTDAIARSRNLLSGTENSLVSGVIRANAIRLILKAANIAPSTKSSGFSDVDGKLTPSYVGYIAKARELQCIQATQTFRPFDYTSEGEYAKMAVCAIKGGLSETTETFPSAPTSSTNSSQTQYPSVPTGGFAGPQIVYLPSSSTTVSNPGYALASDLTALSAQVATLSGNTGHSPATLGTTNGLSLSGQQISLGLASASTTGALSTADWIAFNNKISLASLGATGPLSYNNTTGIFSITPGANGEVLSVSGGVVTWVNPGSVSIPVTSVFGRVGVVTAQSGDYTTDLVTEASNLYFTNTRAQNALSGTIASIDGNISSITGQLVTINNNISSASGQISGLSSSLATTNTSLASATGTIASLSGNLVNLTSLVNTLSGIVHSSTGGYYSGTDFQPQIDTLSGQVALLSNQVTIFAFTLGPIVTLVNSFSGTLSQHTADIASLSGNLTSLTSSFNTLSGTVSTITSNLTALSGVVASNSTNIANLSGALASLSGTVNSIQSDVASLQALAHDAVTLGTPNGLSLSGQQISLALASSGSTGALSVADWITFNNKINLTSLSALGPITYNNATGVFGWSGSTTDVIEGSNLYWTQSRFDTAFGLKSTTNLTEGTNLYFTDSRAQSALSGTILGIRNDLASATGSIATLQTNLATATGNISTLSGNLSTTNSNLILTNANLATATGQIESLSGQVATINGNISTLSGALSTLTSTVNSLSGVVATHTVEIATLSGQTATNTANIATLSGVLSTLSTTVSTLSGSLATLTSTVDTLSGQTVTNTANISSLSGTVATISLTLSSLSGVVSTLSSTVTSLSGSLASTNSNLATATGNILSLQSNLSTATGQIASISGSVLSLSGVVSTLASQIAALSGQAHDAVTLGTPNGLSLSGQQISLALASSGSTGALSVADWIAFNGKVSFATVLSGFTPTVGTVVGTDTLFQALEKLQGTNTLQDTNLGIATGAILTLQTNLATATGQIVSLSGTVTTLQSQVSALSGTVAGLQTQITTLSGSLSALTNTVNSLSGVVSQNSLDISTLSGSVAGNTANISALSGSLASTNSTLSSLSGVVSALSTTVSTISGSLITLSSTVSSLSGAVAGNTANISALSGSLSALTNTVNSLSGVLAGVISDVSTLSGSLSAVITSLTSLSGTVAGNTANISSLSGSLSSLSSTVSSLSGSLATTNANLATATGNILSLQTNLATATGQIASLSGQILTINGNISSITGQLVTINSNIASATGNILSLQANLASATGNILSLQNNLATATGQILALSGSLATTNANLATATGNILSLQSNLAAATGSIATLQTNLATATGNISTLSGNLNTLSGNLTSLSGVVATKIGLTSLSANGPLTYNSGSGVFGINIANSTTTGALSVADWITFNNKINLTSLSALGPITYNNATGVFGWSGSTTDVIEGSNLYWTQSRFDTAFGLKSTTNLTEGTNLYFTDSRAQSALSGTILTINGNISSITGQLVTINSNIASATGNILSLLNNLATATGQISSLSGVVSSLSTQISTLSGSLSTLTATVNSLSGVVATNTANISALSGSLASTNSTLSSLSGVVSSLSTQISTLSGSLSTLSTTVNSLSGQTATNIANIATLSGALSTLSTTVSTISGSVAALSGTVGNILTSLATTNANLATATGQIATLNTNVATITGQLITINSNIASATGSIANLQANLATATGQIATLSGNLSTLSGTVSAIITSLATTNANLATATGNILSLQTNLATATGQIASLSGQILTINGNISSITGQLVTINSNIASATGNILSLQSNLAVATGSIATLQTNLATATGNIATLSGNLNTLSGNLTSLSGTVATLLASSHSPVTLGTPNGLSLSGQQISLALASSGSTGALSVADWINFNSKINLTSLSATGGVSYNNTTGVIGDLFTFNNGLTRTGNTVGLSLGSNGQVLSMSGSTPTWITLAGGGISSLNGLSSSVQTFAIGTAGSTFNISSTGTVHTFNLPIASSSATGILSSADYLAFSGKISLTSLSATGLITYNNTTGVIGWTGTTTNISEGTNLYFTNARAIAASLTGFTPGAGTVTSADSVLQAIQKLQGTNTLQDTNIATATGNILSLQSNLATATGNIATLSGNLTSLSGSLSALTSTVNTLSGNILTLSGQLASLSGSLSSLTSTVNSLSGSLATTNANLATATGNILSLQTNLATATGQIASLSGQILTINGNISSITGQLVTINSNIASATGNILSLQSNLAVATGSIATLQTNLATATGNIATLSGNLNTLSGNLTSLSGVVATKIGLTSLSVTGPLTYNSGSGVFGINIANSTTTGALSATDWNIFNTKESTLTFNNGLTRTGNTIGLTLGSNGQYLSMSGGAPVWSTIPSALVTSVFGRTGAILGVAGDYNTSLVTESGSLYFTNTRARAALSANGPLSYDNSTGIFSIFQATSSTGGYLSAADWNTFNNKQGALTILSPANGLSLVGTGLSLALASSTTTGALSVADWVSFNSKLTSLNGLTATGQTFAIGTAGNDFNIVSSGSIHTFNLPDASTTARGVVSTGAQTFTGAKTFTVAPTLSGFTQGSVLFAGTGGTIAQDNAGIYYNGSNKRLGLGTNAPKATLHNSGSTIFGAITVASLTASGNIGTAAATVDIATTFNINQTGANLTFTLPTPTDTTAGRIAYVNNVGTKSFFLYGTQVIPSSSRAVIWNGSAWVLTGNADDRTPGIARKLADESVVSSAALQNDDHFSFSVGSGETWMVEFSVFTKNGGSAGGAKVALSLPAGSTNCSNTVLTNYNGAWATNTGCATALTVPNLNNYATTGNSDQFTYIAVFKAGANGTAQFQWAQNTANATALTFMKDSTMNYSKLSGADLAEVYYAIDGAIGPGDIVSLAGDGVSQVTKTTKAYDPRAIGVISTKPGIVIGEADGSGKPVVVGLSGRVPVKVTGANGEIKPGDFITTSDIPGVGMKATEPGRVIGKALTAFSGTEQGTVMVFIQNTYFDGIDETEYSNTLGNSGSLQVENRTLDRFSYMVKKSLLKIDPSYLSPQASLSGSLDVSTIGNTMTTIASAVSGVSTSLDETRATVRSQADIIAGLQADLLALSGAIADRHSATISTEDQGVLDSIISSAGKLSVQAETVFTEAVTFSKKAIFNSSVEFHGRVTFYDRDMAGTATIPTGAHSVRVDFSSPYAITPKITASADDFVSYRVTSKSGNGFTIELESPATREVSFDWIALYVKGASSTVSHDDPPPGDPPPQTDPGGTGSTVSGEDPPPSDPPPDRADTSTGNTTESGSVDPPPGTPPIDIGPEPPPDGISSIPIASGAISAPPSGSVHEETDNISPDTGTPPGQLDPPSPPLTEEPPPNSNPSGTGQDPITSGSDPPTGPPLVTPTESSTTTG